MAGMNRWKTKVAFVTGANGGIGMAITRKLLDSGLTVVAIDLQTEALLVSTAYATRARSSGLFFSPADIVVKHRLGRTHTPINICFSICVFLNTNGCRTNRRFGYSRYSFHSSRRTILQTVVVAKTNKVLVKRQYRVKTELAHFNTGYIHT